ncbi:transmembrane protein 100-like [Sander vitreus]
MAHLFLASKISTPDDLHLHGARIPRSVVGTTHIPHVNEVQLSAATGGAETSCSRCTMPFGVVVLIAGVVVTAVAYAFNSHGSVISVLGLALLAAGLLLLAASAVCWRQRHRAQGRDQRRESQTALMASQGYCLA